MSETNCNIIKDLLPLYCDGVCSEESKYLVEKHLEECDGCAEELREIREMPDVSCGDVSVDESIKKAGKRFKKLKKRSVIKAVAICCAAVLILGSFSVLQLALNSSKTVYYECFQECELDESFTWENKEDGKIDVGGLKINLPDSNKKEDDFALLENTGENGIYVYRPENSDGKSLKIICNKINPENDLYEDDGFMNIFRKIVLSNLRKQGYNGANDPKLAFDARDPRKAPSADIFSLPTTKLKAISYYFAADLLLPIYPNNGKYIAYECDDYFAFGGINLLVDDNIESVDTWLTLDIVSTDCTQYYNLYLMGFNKTEILQILSSVTFA